jgi:poly(ADP-ribose) glycohydrolase ARH3
MESFMAGSTCDREERFVGAMLGTAYGDALGAGVEGVSRSEIRERFGEVRDFLPHRGAGRYTDDTQMTLALALSLIRVGDVDGADCARRYEELFEPERGYGRSAAAVLEALRGGADYRRTGTMFFAAGSFGNGAAMRIAPVGLVFGSGDPDKLRAKVFEAVRCTHVHPEAVDGATIQALAVSLMAHYDGRAPVDSAGMLKRLRKVCRTEALHRKLRDAEDLLADRASDDEAIRVLGTGVASAESVPAAIFTALRHGADPEEALVRAVGLGGDTDTIAAMTGALMGALHGRDHFPRRWFDTLENGRHGRDEIILAARRLALMAEAMMDGR